MRERKTDARGVARRLGTLALALWLGGFGCLLGCEPMASAATMMHTPHAQVASESHDAMNDAMNHGCCHRAKKNVSATASVESGAKTDVGQSPCPFNTSAVDASRKVGVKSVASMPASDALPQVARAFLSFDPPFSRARPPDRGGTYLRCCVFLI
jgi:hypothetical protein